MAKCNVSTTGLSDQFGPNDSEFHHILSTGSSEDKQLLAELVLDEKKRLLSEAYRNGDDTFRHNLDRAVDRILLTKEVSV